MEETHLRPNVTGAEVQLEKCFEIDPVIKSVASSDVKRDMEVQTR